MAEAKVKRPSSTTTIKKVVLSGLNAGESNAVKRKIDYIRKYKNDDSYIHEMMELLPSFDLFALRYNFEGKVEIVTLQEDGFWTSDQMVVNKTFSTKMLPELRGLLLFGMSGDVKSEPGPDGSESDGDTMKRTEECSFEGNCMLIGASLDGPRSKYNLIHKSLFEALQMNHATKLCVFEIVSHHPVSRRQVLQNPRAMSI